MSAIELHVLFFAPAWLICAAVYAMVEKRVFWNAHWGGSIWTAALVSFGNLILAGAPLAAAILLLFVPAFAPNHFLYAIASTFLLLLVQKLLRAWITQRLHPRQYFQNLLAGTDTLKMTSRSGVSRSVLLLVIFGMFAMIFLVFHSVLKRTRTRSQRFLTIEQLPLGVDISRIRKAFTGNWPHEIVVIPPRGNRLQSTRIRIHNYNPKPLFADDEDSVVMPLRPLIEIEPETVLVATALCLARNSAPETNALSLASIGYYMLTGFALAAFGATAFVIGDLFHLGNDSIFHITMVSSLLICYCLILIRRIGCLRTPLDYYVDSYKAYSSLGNRSLQEFIRAAFEWHAYFYQIKDPAVAEHQVRLQFGFQRLLRHYADSYTVPQAVAADCPIKESSPALISDPRS
jgi:hypothetical protein